jgi:DNA-binding response OmpR family regulator
MRALVVEDDAGIAGGLADSLQQAGYAVDVCGGVKDAWAALSVESFDVLVLDLGLPDGNGIELIRQVSQKKPEADIMVVTVFGDEQHVVSSIEAGATGYILKDSTPADVISCIRLLRAGGSPVSPVVARSVPSLVGCMFW